MGLQEIRPQVQERVDGAAWWRGQEGGWPKETNAGCDFPQLAETAHDQAEHVNTALRTQSLRDPAASVFEVVCTRPRASMSPGSKYVDAIQTFTPLFAHPNLVPRCVIYHLHSPFVFCDIMTP